jgi:serine/threonine protein kinase
LPREIAK